MTRVAQTERPGYRRPKEKTKRSVRPAVAIIAAFLTRSRELDRAKASLRTKTVQQFNGSDQRRKARASLAQSLHLLGQNMASKRLCGGVVFRTVSFAAAELGVASDHKRGGRNPGG